MTRKGGRPHKKPKAGERVQLSFRITASLKRRLVIAGKISGRSQSQEAELRIEQSFWMEDLIRARLMPEIVSHEPLAQEVFGAKCATTTVQMYNKVKAKLDRALSVPPQKQEGQDG